MPPFADIYATAARLVCFGFDGLAMNSHCERMIDSGCGAVIIFSRNISSPHQVATLCASMKRRAHPRKLLVMVDQEGGRVARFSENNHFTQIPSAQDVGNALDPVVASQTTGDVIGKELRAVNVDMTLAPVVDVNTNPLNIVIGDRSFGSDTNKVGEVASAFIRALQKKGVAACAKHWPGHGDSAGDSHDSLPTIAHTYERLRAVEIPPFLDAIAAGVASILVAHLVVPGMEHGAGDTAANTKGGDEKNGPTLPPASCSRSVVGALRNRFGFRNVIMSDDMEMGALLSLPGGVGRCAVDGLLAGVDLCLVCHSEEPQREVIAALAGAIAKDERARKNAAAAHARLDDLCKRFVDGAETAEAKAEAFSLSRVDAEAIVGKSSDQERVERAVGVSRL